MSDEDALISNDGVVLDGEVVQGSALGYVAVPPAEPPTTFQEEGQFNYNLIINELDRQEVLKRAKIIRGYARQSLENMLLCGTELNWVKGKLGHGLFMRWVDQEFPMSRRTATSFMAVAEVFGPKIIGGNEPNLITAKTLTEGFKTENFAALNLLPTTAVTKLAAVAVKKEDFNERQNIVDAVLDVVKDTKVRKRTDVLKIIKMHEDGKEALVGNVKAARAEDKRAETPKTQNAVLHIVASKDETEAPEVLSEPNLFEDSTEGILAKELSTEVISWLPNDSMELFKKVSTLAKDVRLVNVNSDINNNWPSKHQYNEFKVTVSDVLAEARRLTGIVNFRIPVDGDESLTKEPKGRQLFGKFKYAFAGVQVLSDYMDSRKKHGNPPDQNYFGSIIKNFTQAGFVMDVPAVDGADVAEGQVPKAEDATVLQFPQKVGVAARATVNERAYIVGAQEAISEADESPEPLIIDETEIVQPDAPDDVPAKPLDDVEGELSAGRRPEEPEQNFTRTKRRGRPVGSKNKPKS